MVLGSAGAKFELQAAVAQRFVDSRASCPLVLLMLHLCDVSIDCCAEAEERAAAATWDAVAQAVVSFEAESRLGFAVDKGLVVATSTTLAARVHRGLGATPGCVGSAVKRLGADFARASRLRSAACRTVDLSVRHSPR